MKTLYFKLYNSHIKFKSNYFFNENDFVKEKIIQSLKISLRKKFKIGLQEFVVNNGFEVEKCGFCDNYSQIDVDFYFEKYKRSNLLVLKNISYPNDYFYCKEKNCPGKKLNPNSKEFVSKSRKISIDESIEIIHNRNKSPFYRKNYKNEDDYKKYQSLNNRLNEDDYKKFIINLKKSKTINYYIDKYGKDDGEKIWYNIQSKKDSMSLDFFIKKNNNNYKKAIIEYNNRKKSVLPNFKGGGYYSMASFNFFKKLVMELKLDNNYCVFGKIEFPIKNKKRMFYYDFLDQKNNIIIEYNGLTWHPSLEKMSNEEFNNWKHPFNKDLKANDIQDKDNYKINTAIKNGFDVIVIWDVDGEEYNLKKIKEYYDRKLHRIS